MIHSPNFLSLTYVPLELFRLSPTITKPGQTITRLPCLDPYTLPHPNKLLNAKLALVDRLTRDEPASLLLERASVGNFGDVLLGSKDEFLIPIILDLGKLPFEATGIVCGVAGRLCGGGRGAGGGGDDDDEGAAEEIDGINKIEMSYLSTTRAGTVMVSEADLERAMGLLRVNGEN